MKYLIELLLIAVFVALCYFGYHNNHYTDDHRIDSLQNEVMKQRIKLDSISQVESVIIEKKKIINNYYTNEASSIIHLTDSDNFYLLRSNLARFSYLYKPQASKDSQLNGERN